jgi:hypothetical protein
MTRFVEKREILAGKNCSKGSFLKTEIFLFGSIVGKFWLEENDALYPQLRILYAALR